MNRNVCIFTLLLVITMALFVSIWPINSVYTLQKERKTWQCEKMHQKCSRVAHDFRKINLVWTLDFIKRGKINLKKSSQSHQCVPILPRWTTISLFILSYIIIAYSLWWLVWIYLNIILDMLQSVFHIRWSITLLQNAIWILLLNFKYGHVWPSI
jgi:hypothetical protein